MLDALNFISGCLVLFCFCGSVAIGISCTQQIHQQRRLDRQEEAKSERSR